MENEGPFKTWPNFVGYSEGITSISEYDDALSKFQYSDDFKDARFRGESKFYTTYLKPTIMRSNRTVYESKLDKNITNQEIKQLRKAQLKRFWYLFWIKPSSSTWLSMAQHYGCATRLLDVTRDKYVALFFACINENNKIPWNPNSDGYVFIFPHKSYRPMSLVRAGVAKRDIEQGIPNHWSEFFEPWRNSPVNSNVGHLFKPTPENKKYNDRMNAQSGEFIWWNPIYHNFPAQVFPIKVNKDSKKQIIEQLISRGYTADTLYPDKYGKELHRRVQKNITNHLAKNRS